jgi:hypothetical protein
MQIAQTATPHIAGSAGKKPPPLWFVTNGDVTVGPVTTNLLVRGVLHERVPKDCLVRERTWTSFRKLERIREIAALRRAQSQYGTVLVEPARWKEPAPTVLPFGGLEGELLRARDPGEVLLRCLTETMRATGACVGAVHRRRPPHPGFVTTCVSGPGMTRSLGQALAMDDPALALAVRGETLCEAPRPAAASGSVRDRLGALPACDGVAMVPILCGERLYAVIELGRPDHEFRGADFQGLRAIAELAADRLGIVRNGPASRALWGHDLLSATS